MGTFMMRSCSSGVVGLWSSVMAMALPLRHSTHLLSPALATVSMLPRTMADTCTRPRLRSQGAGQRLQRCCLTGVALKPSSCPAQQVASDHG